MICSRPGVCVFVFVWVCQRKNECEKENVQKRVFISRYIQMRITHTRIHSHTHSLSLSLSLTHAHTHVSTHQAEIHVHEVPSMRCKGLSMSLKLILTCACICMHVCMHACVTACRARPIRPYPEGSDADSPRPARSLSVCVRTYNMQAENNAEL